jgi:hypothetical protein
MGSAPSLQTWLKTEGGWENEAFAGKDFKHGTPLDGVRLNVSRAAIHMA